MKLAGYVVTTQPGTLPAAPIVTCSVQKRQSALCARDLCTSQVKFGVAQSDLFQLDAASEPGPAYALWNNEWSGLSRHWTLVYHKCTMQVAEDTHYKILFDGDDIIREVPIEVQLTGDVSIPGCMKPVALTPDFIESIPAYNPAYVQYPIVPIDLDAVDKFTTSLNDNDRGQSLEPLEGYLAESGAWHRWDTIKTLSTRGEMAIAPYVIDYGSVSK